MTKWKPFSTSPKNGEFIVFMPNHRRKIQTASRSTKDNGTSITIIGGAFSFDFKPEEQPTLWTEMPELPNEHNTEVQDES